MGHYPDKYSNHKRTPFNGVVVGLGKKILKCINRFEIIGTNGRKSYFLIPFEGWHEKGEFVWKIRNELVQALEELGLVDNPFKNDFL